jgi:hypothetical protein
MNQSRSLIAGIAGALALATTALAQPSSQTATNAAKLEAWNKIVAAFHPPGEFQSDFGSYASPLLFSNGTKAVTPADWARRRKEIVDYWMGVIGPWPPLLDSPRIERQTATNRGAYVEHQVKVDYSASQRGEGYLLVPSGTGPFPAVLVPFYEAETSIGRKGELRDFALQLTKRGFVTLSIGSPGGDAWRPDTANAHCQPLAYLAYVAANCHTALAHLTEVYPQRIGVVGHSYGGKWAMFASCLFEKFACAAWSDPGVVFDETRPNVNYWEQWYLGFEPGRKRLPGIPWEQNPRTGAYKRLWNEKHNLHELHALMAPRPFLVSGGSEDPPERWRALNHSVAVNALLGATNRVAMTHRPTHSPTAESNEALYSFFEYFLK